MFNFFNLFKTQPTTLAEGEAEFAGRVPNWTEAQLVAWINDQFPENQRFIWNRVQDARADGLGQAEILRMLRELRYDIEQNGDDAATVRSELFVDNIFALRTGWWFGGVLSGKNKI